MLTSDKIPTSLLVFLIILADICVNVNGDDLYEGSACKMKDGRVGTCTKLPECESIDKLLRTRKIPFSSLDHCSFVGNIQVICCPDRKPTNPLTPTNPEGTDFILKTTSTTSRPLAESSESSSEEKDYTRWRTITSTERNAFHRPTSHHNSWWVPSQRTPKRPDSRENDLKPWQGGIFRTITTTRRPHFWNGFNWDQQHSNEGHFRITTTTTKPNFWGGFNWSVNKDSQFQATTTTTRPYFWNGLNWGGKNHSSTEASESNNIVNNYPITTTSVRPVTSTTTRKSGFDEPDGIASTTTTKPNFWSGWNWGQENISSSNNSESSNIVNFPIISTTKKSNLWEDNEVTTSTTTRRPFNESGEIASPIKNLPSTTTESPIERETTEDIISFVFPTNRETTISTSTTVRTVFENESIAGSSDDVTIPSTEKPFITTTLSPFTNSTQGVNATVPLDKWMLDVLLQNTNSTTQRPSTTSSSSRTIDISEVGPNEISSSTNPRPVSPTPAEPRNSGRKAEIACSRYSVNASLLLDFHILGGVPTVLGEFPHMAALGYPTIGEGSLLWDCGGSLISERFVLTAAHCVSRQTLPTVIRLGKIVINGDEDGAEALDMGLEEIISHPKYRASRQYHDIALIRLNGVVPFNDYIRPACLNVDVNDVIPNLPVVATGWGTTSLRTREKSPVLLKVNLTSVALDSCNRSHVEYGLQRRYPNGLDQGQLCAFDPGLEKDACQGDSGGPLQLVSKNGVSVIVGVVSFGIACASEIPGVYARVAYYLQWIESVVW